MKYLLLLVSFALLITISFPACLRDCVDCTNQTICTKCNTGFFLKKNTQCQPCPQYCKTCNQGTNGVVCTECVSNAFLESSNRCLLCQTSCLKCQGTSTNCSSCIDGLSLNSSNSCINLKQCPEKNCLNCNADSISIKNYFCEKCQIGFYSFRRGCDKCLFASKQCRFDIQRIWNNMIKNFWISKRTALKKKIDGGTRLLQAVNQYTENYTLWNISEWNEAKWTSEPLNNYSQMNVSRVKGWTQLFYFFRAISTNKSDEQTEILMYKSLSLFEEILNLTISNSSQQWEHLGRFINNITNSSIWNAVYLNNKLRQEAFKNVTIQACIDGYGYNTEIGVCQRCSNNCLKCSNSSSCSICNQGYLLNSKSLCTSCDNSCTQCKFLNSSDQKTTICTKCKRQFSLIPNSQGKCSKCKQLSCLQCLANNASQCITCMEGYGIINQNCVQCPNNCLSCSINISGNICYACKNGFTLINNTCQMCRSGCLKCSQKNSTVCYKCFDGLYLDKQTGSCKICMNGCKSCINSQSCSQNKPGYIYYSGQFIKCSRGCSKCDNSDPSKCIQCQTKFYLDSNNCKPCTNYCLACEKQKCIKCSVNSILVQNGTCIRCPKDCLTCNQANNGSIQCTSCLNGFNFQLIKSCTQSCSKDCLTCALDGLCTSCPMGYTLKNGKCVGCLQNCLGTCDPQNITQCIGCPHGFERINNICRKCIEGCSRCLNKQCISCEDGYKLAQASGSFICLRECKYPCNNCTNDKCLNCVKGYKLQKKDSCIPDLSCNPFCFFCVSGSFKNLTTYNCELCPNSCATCINETICLSCFDSFYLNQNNICIACSMPCLNCIDNNLCTSCAKGYVLQIVQQQKEGIPAIFGTKCIPCRGACEVCQYIPEKCLKCIQGFSLRGSKCVLRYSVRFNYTIDYSYEQFLKNMQVVNFTKSLKQLLNISEDRIIIQFIREGSTNIQGQAMAVNEREASNLQHIMLKKKLGNYSVKYSNFQVLFEGQNYGPQQRYNRYQDEREDRIGLIIGIIISVIVLIALLVLLGCWCYKRRIRQSNNQYPDVMSDGGNIQIASASSKGTHQRITDVL